MTHQSWGVSIASARKPTITFRRSWDTETSSISVWVEAEHHGELTRSRVAAIKADDFFKCPTCEEMIEAAQKVLVDELMIELQVYAAMEGKNG